MKTLRQLSHNFTLPLLALLFSSFALIGCGGSKTAPLPASITRTAVLSGAQEPTPVVTNATGYGSIVVDPTTRAVSGSVTFNGVTATNAHIHTGAVGTNGPIAVGLTLGANSATVPANTVLTQTQYDDLLAGNLYFNVHSGANPAGEIRGQIGVDIHSARLSAAQELNNVTSTATGTGFVVVDPVTRAISGGVTFANLTGAGANAAHIHTGAVGVNGTILVGLTLNATVPPTSATVPAGTVLTQTQYDDLLAGNLYFNVHSAANGGGEIRGQLVSP